MKYNPKVSDRYDRRRKRKQLERMGKKVLSPFEGCLKIIKEIDPELRMSERIRGKYSDYYMNTKLEREEIAEIILSSGICAIPWEDLLENRKEHYLKKADKILELIKK